MIRLGRGHPRHQLAFALALIPGLLWCGLALGQAESRSAPTPSSSGVGDGAVEIAVVGTAADLQRIRAVVEPRNPGSARPRWTRVGRFDPMEILRGDRDRDGVALRCWVDVLDPKRARLYFAARSGRQFLVRDVELSGKFDEVDRESLSQVIELSVTALLENERAGLTRAQAQALLASREPTPARAGGGSTSGAASVPPRAPSAPSAPSASAVPIVPPAPPVSPPQPPRVAPSEPPPPARPAPTEPPPPPVRTESSEPPPTVVERQSPPARSASQWGASVFYGVQALASRPSFAQGPGLALSWGAAGDRPGLGAWLSGQYQLPGREAGPSVSVRFETIAARGGLELRLPVVGHQLGIRVGIGTDLVRLSPQPGTADPSAVLTAERWSQSLVFTAAVGMRFALGRHMLVGASLLADVLPTVVHYDLEVAGSPSEVFSPWRVRPGLALEFAVR